MSKNTSKKPHNTGKNQIIYGLHAVKAALLNEKRKHSELIITKNHQKSMIFCTRFRKRENVKMAASCRRERQNGGLKGCERQQKSDPKQCRKTHSILMHFGSEELTTSEQKCCPKPFKKLMKKSLKTTSKNRGRMYRKMEPKMSPRRHKTPTSCRQNPDMEPGTPRDAKKEPKLTPNGSKMVPKGS